MGEEKRSIHEIMEKKKAEIAAKGRAAKTAVVEKPPKVSEAKPLSDYPEAGAKCVADEDFSFPFGGTMLHIKRGQIIDEQSKIHAMKKSRCPIQDFDPSKHHQFVCSSCGNIQWE
jgi:hypothetical protein